MGASIFALCTMAGLTVQATQWIVDDDGPADFRLVQEAIDAVYVHTGDTILVRPGLYAGNVVLSAKDLVIMSEAGPWATILDGQNSGSVVTLTGRSFATRLEGFTLRNGRDQTGGGIWIYAGGPVITRNVIEGNSAVGGALGYGYGGGIEVYSSAAVITRNIIRGNTALDGAGGIDVYYSGPSTPGTCCPLIAQNTIVDNVVTGATGMGGGILSFGSESRISSNIIVGNIAASGGGLYVDWVQGLNDAPTASSNIFNNNVPDAAASRRNWRLPSSNLQADPRLGEGLWFNLWPRSDSPALDAAEGGLPAGPDLTGYPTPVDSDLDGTTAGDVGALENRSEITALEVMRDPADATAAVLTWDGSIDPNVVFNLYVSGEAFRSDGGACLAAGLAVVSYTDAAPMTPGEIRFYVVTGRGAVEGSRGFRSDGTPRPSIPGCLGS